MNWRAWVGLSGLALLAGCSNPGYFVCTADAECTEADGSRCEPSGACSIPDPTCPTGRRYGELGNPEIAGQCVPADDIGSTGSDPTLATDGGASGSGAAVSGGTSESVGTTEDEQSTSSSGEGSSTSTAGESSDGASSSTGGGVPADMWADCADSADCTELCAPVVELASLDPVGHWCTRFECDDPTLDCGDPGTGAVPTCLPLEFGGDLSPRCILDCTDMGTAGCPEGMECFDVFMSPSRCAHPVSE